MSKYCSHRSRTRRVLQLAYFRSGLITHGCTKPGAQETLVVTGTLSKTFAQSVLRRAIYLDMCVGRLSSRLSSELARSHLDAIIFPTALHGLVLGDCGPVQMFAKASTPLSDSPPKARAPKKATANLVGLTVGLLCDLQFWLGGRPCKVCRTQTGPTVCAPHIQIQHCLQPFCV